MRKLLKLSITFFAVLILLYSVAGFQLLPKWVESRVETMIKTTPELTGHINTVDFNPFTLTLRMKDMQLNSTTEDSWSFALETGTMNFDILSILQRYPILDSIKLTAPRLSLRINTNDEEKEEAETVWTEKVARLRDFNIPELTIKSFRIERGQIRYFDPAPPPVYRETIFPVEISLQNLTTKGKGQGKLKIAAETDGGAHLKWVAHMGTHPMSSNGRLSLEGLSIGPLAAYLNRWLSFRVQEAKLDLDCKYQLNLSNPEQLLRLSQGTIIAHNIRCHQPGQKDDSKMDNEFLTLDLLKAEETEYLFPQNQLNIQKLTFKGGQTTIWRSKEGSISILQLLIPPDVTESTAYAASQSSKQVDNTESPIKPFSYQIEHTHASDYRLVWKQSEAADSALIAIDVPHLSGRNISSDPSRPISVEGLYQLNRGGEVGITGSFQRKPLHYNLEIDASELALAPAHLLFDGSEAWRISKGTLNFKGQINNEDSPHAQIKGDGNIEDFDANWKADPQLSMRSKIINFDGFDLKTEPFGLALNQLLLKNPQLVWTLGSSDSESNTDSAPEARGKASGLELRIKETNIQSGGFTFVDETLSPHVSVPLQSVNAVIRGINPGDTKPAQIHLDAKGTLGQFVLDGSVRLAQFREATEFQLSASDIEMRQFSPYAKKGLGRGIEQGIAAIEADWKIQDGNINATNSVNLTDFKLAAGEGIEVASLLPVGTIVKLLKTPSGQIQLSLPISGDLSQPDVSLNSIARNAIAGFIYDLAASPFRLLSSIAGTTENLSELVFSPGSPLLTDKMQSRLEQISKALKQRPEVHLKIIPKITEDDEQALKDARPEIVSEEGLQKLARKRAELVRDQLVDSYDIEPERIQISGFERDQAPSGVRFELL